MFNNEKKLLINFKINNNRNLFFIVRSYAIEYLENLKRIIKEYKILNNHKIR